ncbi:hypothetical protein SAMN05518672_1186 [Chitinophaga sp. CF118]|nr:hypothetical protein [Chitinophaga sp. CF118]SFF11513.1 hypothetical protein SAMN05518672_1186 [Chitinophaga sp. CF118]
MIRINGIPYRQGNEYTIEGKESIISIATKMVSEIEKHPENFN